MWTKLVLGKASRHGVSSRKRWKKSWTRYEGGGTARSKESGSNGPRAPTCLEGRRAATTPIQGGGSHRVRGRKGPEKLRCSTKIRRKLSRNWIPCWTVTMWARRVAAAVGRAAARQGRRNEKTETASRMGGRGPELVVGRSSSMVQGPYCIRTSTRSVCLSRNCWPMCPSIRWTKTMRRDLQSLRDPRWSSVQMIGHATRGTSIGTIEQQHMTSCPTRTAMTSLSTYWGRRWEETPV